SNIQDQLMEKLKTQSAPSELSSRDKGILMFIELNNGCRSGDISKKLSIPLPTVKKALAGLVAKGLIERRGTGPGTHYSAN
ncbi:MAG TPA: helix-turn-helix domain-containing protein, partial [Flavisolibacter sp.]|nr:helix-turn-helix domain-containing protein [Flavisolibacter sp.]